MSIGRARMLRRFLQSTNHPSNSSISAVGRGYLNVTRQCAQLHSVCTLLLGSVEAWGGVSVSRYFKVSRISIYRLFTSLEITIKTIKFQDKAARIAVVGWRD